MISLPKSNQTQTTDALHHRDFGLLKKDWDLVVIGAGVAGTLAARMAKLHHPHWSVLLVDKSRFPRDKVCGGCLNQSTLASLELAGLSHLCDQSEAGRYNLLHLTRAGQSVECGLPLGRTLSRKTMDQALVEAAREVGVEFIDHCFAEVLESADLANTRQVKLKIGLNTQIIDSRMLLVSDGLAGRALRHDQAAEELVDPHSYIGIGVTLEDPEPAYQAQRIYMVSGDHGYIGLTRVENGLLNIAAAFSPSYIRESGGPNFAALRMLEYNDCPVSCAIAEASFTGVPALSRRRRQLWSQRCLVIGDSAEYLEPFTGEGMAWAAASAHHVQAYLEPAVEEWNPGIGIAWQEHYRQVISPRKRVCQWVKKGLRWGLAVDRSLPLLNWFPQPIKIAARLINRQIPSPGLSTSFHYSHSGAHS